jgi:hypothetical protein
VLERERKREIKRRVERASEKDKGEKVKEG